MERNVWTDQRYKTANREAWIGMGLVIFNFIWWYGFAYGLGSKSPEDYHYIFGFPAWFFFSCILGFIIMMILTVFVVKFFFKDMSLETEEEE
ncbi:YhdT family protein [Oceanobacillus timonensis]|uniref:YhdT family protein n=1 Tax=Oceanobacillus timonensis TaxID=1926285 RepID=UPI0009BB6FD1|nr:YhdT family protein [Oceanobacillus timonensis]